MMRDHHVYGNSSARLESMRTSPRLENGVYGITAEEEDDGEKRGRDTKHSTKFRLRSGAHVDRVFSFRDGRVSRRLRALR
jgi:hypothetical protein